MINKGVSLPLRLGAILFLTGMLSPLLDIAHPAEVKSPPERSLAETYEKDCVAHPRALNVAQVTYWGGDRAKGYARTLKELGPAGADLLNGVITSGKMDDYRFKLTPEHTTANYPIMHYTITARPIRRLTKNQKSFFTDESGVIRYTTENRRATVRDSPLDSALRQ